ncbi:FHIPEP family type III secretion protein [Vibrio lentus]|nr:FHIPEP family type III secretion protein [Vibrio lentus]
MEKLQHSDTTQIYEITLPLLRTSYTKSLTVPCLRLARPLWYLPRSLVIVANSAFLLDMFFTFNIALSMVVLLVSVYTRRPLDFCCIPNGTSDCHSTSTDA